MSAQLIDLPAVKAAADFERILAHYGVALLGIGDQRRALCPFHTETKPSFKVNVRRKLFHCFGCDRHGNVLDFVMQKEDAKEPRAAARIAEICGFALPTKNGADDHAVKRAIRPGDAQKNLETAEPPQGPETCTSAAYTRDNRVSDSKTEVSDPAVINPVLTFTLKLEPDHPYLGTRGISAELAATFGLGLATRGSMRGRIAIPIHNAHGELVAHAGRWPGDELPEGVEKYVLPAKFKKTHVLYNLHRVAGRKHVIVVEGYFGAIRLHALGVPAVALMGRTIAAEQVELLVAAGVKAVTVMLDGDAPGRTAIPELLPLLARRLFVRVAELPDGLEPDTAAAEIIRELVRSRS